MPPYGIGTIRDENGRERVQSGNAAGASQFTRSIVVASLQKINGLIRDTVHQAVFLSDAARPTPRQ